MGNRQAIRKTSTTVFTRKKFFLIHIAMSTKRTPSEIPLVLGVRTVGDAIRVLSMDDSEGGQSQAEGAGCNWNENSSAVSDKNPADSSATTPTEAPSTNVGAGSPDKTEEQG